MATGSGGVRGDAEERFGVSHPPLSSPPLKSSGDAAVLARRGPPRPALPDPPAAALARRPPARRRPGTRCGGQAGACRAARARRGPFGLLAAPPGGEPHVKSGGGRRAKPRPPQRGRARARLPEAAAGRGRGEASPLFLGMAAGAAPRGAA